MKKVSSKILSMLLACVMLLCVAPAAMAANPVEPTGWDTLVWENSFNHFDITSEAVSVGSTAKEDKTLDIRMINLNYEVLSDGSESNRYLSVSANPDANSGVLANIYSSSAKNYFTSGNGIDEWPIDKLKLEFRLRIPENAKMAVKSNYQSTQTTELLQFLSDGTFTINGNETAYSYTNEWTEYELYIDYVSQTILCYADNTYVGSGDFSDEVLANKYFNYIQFNPQTDNEEKKAFEIDYIKYFTSYSENYVDRIATDCSQGYTEELANFTFEEFATNTDLTSNTNFKFYDGSTSEDLVATVVAREDGKGKCVDFYNKYDFFGPSDALLESSDVYENYGKLPEIVKVSVEMHKKGKTDAAYIHIGGTESDESKGYQILLWSNGSGMCFNNGGARVTPGLMKQVNNDWVKFTFYINFAEHTYDAFVNDAYVNTYTLPSNLTDIKSFSVKSHGAGGLLIDNMSVTTIPAYAAPVISEYTDNKEQKKLSFLAKNEEATDKTYKILLAKYTADGVLDSVTISDGSVAANTAELEELSYPAIALGGSYYYKYFVWDGMETLVPLVEEKEIK